MVDHSPVTVAVIGHDQAAAQARRTVVLDALRGHNGSANNMAAVAVGGAQDGAVAWVRAELHRDVGARCLIVSPGASSDDALELLQAGAAGVLADHIPGWVLRHAAAVVRRGGTFLDPWLAAGIADHARPRAGNLCGVTGAEQRVLNLTTSGLEVSEIAAALSVSPDTVKGHLHSLQERLGVTRQEMVKSARDGGLLPVGGNRAKAAVFDSTRGLSGLSLFVVGRERLAGETLVGAMRGTGARVAGYGSSVETMEHSTEQWNVTLTLARDAGTDFLQLRHARPRAALVVVPWLMDGLVVRSALGARAQGIIGVGAAMDDLVAAIRVAASGGLYLDTSALRLMLGSIDYRPRQPSGPLTVRQLEVLSLVDRGYSNRRIGSELGLAEPTVKGHMRRTLRQLGVTDRQEAVVSARRLGLLDTG